MNFSVRDPDDAHSAGSHGENALFATFYAVVFIVSLPCNVLALWVFYHSKSSSSSKVFLLNLAIADMCYLLVLPTRVVYHALNGDWPLGEAACRAAGFLFFINLYCSMYFITCVGLDRVLAVCLPLKAQSLRKSRNGKAISGVLWTLVTLSMAPVLFTRQTVTPLPSGRNGTNCNQLYLEKGSFRALVSTAVAIAVPVFTLTVSYLLILIKLRAMSFNQRKSVQGKSVRMILLTLGTFAVAFVPYHVHRLLYIERHERGDLSHLERRSLAFGNRLTSALTCVSGVMDPLLYFFLAHNYQKSLRRMCGRATNRDSSQLNT